jgi:hypothetical protein
VRGLKFLVIVMGVMLIVGVAALVAGVAYRLQHPRPAPTAAPPFAAAPIDLPPGARIGTIGVGNDRVVLDIALPDGTRELVIIDLASGRRLGVIPLRPAP